MFHAMFQVCTYYVLPTRTKYHLEIVSIYLPRRWSVRRRPVVVFVHVQKNRKIVFLHCQIHYDGVLPVLL
jgi:hypothetical protein